MIYLEDNDLIIPAGIGGGTVVEEKPATLQEITLDSSLNQRTTDVTPDTTDIYPDEGYDGFSKITLKSLTRYQPTVDASTATISYWPEKYNRDVFTGFRVNQVTSAIDGNIQPDNIKKDVTILGVTGTLDSSVSPTPYYGELTKVHDYFYDSTYYHLDYDYAYDYFDNLNTPPAVGACSAIASGSIVGRNLDWLYSNQVDFLVRTERTLGIAGAVSGLTKAVVESDPYNELYRIMPFYLQDGINEYGLFAEINVVPTAGNTQTTPDVITDRVCSLMLVRYILDHYKTVDEALLGLESVQIYFPQVLLDMGYEAHWLIADSTQAQIIEIYDNKLQVIKQNKSTNFHLYGTRNIDDYVYYPGGSIPDEHKTPGEANNIEDYGTGLERWNILCEADRQGIVDASTMRTVMNSVMFSNAYTLSMGEFPDYTFWYSEFVGGSITVNTPCWDSDFRARCVQYKQYWQDRTRENPTVWHTTHSCVYDLIAGTLNVITQETDAAFNTILEMAPTALLEESVTVKSGNTNETIYPSTGYAGFASVIVEKVKLQEQRNYTMNKSEATTVRPGSGYDGMKTIVITPRVKENTIINPTVDGSTMAVPSGYCGFGTLTVNPVTSSIDSHILPENIKKDVTILGVTGTYESGGPSLNIQENKVFQVTEPAGAFINPDAGYDVMRRVQVSTRRQTKVITPTTSEQIIVPDASYNGISQVTVYGVNRNIDRNIQPENIKKDVTILGVTGTYESEPIPATIYLDASTCFGYSTFTRLPSYYDMSRMTEIPKYMFGYCRNLEKITLPSTITSIGENAFISCESLRTFTFPSSLESIADSAFSGTSLQNALILSPSLQSIGSHAFSYTPIGTFHIATTSLTSLATNVCSNCSNLSVVRLPSTLEEIGIAFNGCTKLRNIYLYGATPPTITNNSIGNVAATGTLHIPSGTLQAYENSSWRTKLPDWTFTDDL